MKYHLKTREECQEIVKKSDAFYCTETEVEGFKVEMYDYRLASYTDFEENQAYELRGLTFVYDSLIDKWERHIALNKFYNINQTIGWMYEEVHHKKIVSIADKRDGSLITFIRFPDGKILAKSKMSFISEQAVMAQKILDDDPLIYSTVSILLEQQLTPIFELTSPYNQIVLNYDNTELQLLQVRLSDGSYINAVDLEDLASAWKIKMAEQFPSKYNNLDTLLERKLIEKDKEGYIGVFEDGQMFKIKTEWYLQLHGLVSGMTRENQLIETILEGNIDDVVSELLPGEKKDFINDVTELVNHKFNQLVEEFINLRKSYFIKYKEDRKEFAINNSKNSLFSGVMKTLNSTEGVEKLAEDEVKKHILHVTRSLGKAKEWLENLKDS